MLPSLNFTLSAQSTDLVSMVYSCIGAEIDDSDGSSIGDVKVTDDTERSTAISDAPAETRSNGHAVVSCRQQQPDGGRQERIVPLTQLRDDGPTAEAGGAPCGAKPEPPPQSTKPSLAVMRQRHLQESSGTAISLLRIFWKLEYAQGPKLLILFSVRFFPVLIFIMSIFHRDIVKAIY